MLHYYNIIIPVVFRTYDETRVFLSPGRKKNENYARITGGGALAIMGNRRKHRQLQPFTRLQLQWRIKERSKI